MARIRFGLVLIAIASGTLFIAGKTGKTVVTRYQDETVFAAGNFAMFLQLIPALLVTATAFLFATTKSRFHRLFAVLPAAMGLILWFVAYAIATNKVVVGPTTLSLPRQPFPFPSQFRVAYSDLVAVMVTTAKENDSSSPASSPPNRNIEFVRQDHTKTIIPVGDLVASAMKDIATTLDAHGIPFVDLDD